MRPVRRAGPYSSWQETPQPPLQTGATNPESDQAPGWRDTFEKPSNHWVAVGAAIHQETLWQQRFVGRGHDSKHPKLSAPAPGIP
jgi:hypothetical protein